jgi:hypothetical protein
MYAAPTTRFAMQNARKAILVARFNAC